MTGTVQIQYRVDASEWSSFVEYVNRKHGDIQGYVGREVVTAIREYIDRDDYAPIESKIDELLNALGRSSEGFTEKKEVGSNDTKKVTTRVPVDLKEEFASWVSENTDTNPGEVLTRALAERREGGRSDRLERKIDRILPDTKSVLAEIDGDGVGTTERRAIAVTKEVRESFQIGENAWIPVDELKPLISETLGISTDSTIRDYVDRVRERIGYVDHPENDTLIVPEHVANELAGETAEAPAAETKRYEELDREEKIHGLRIEGARVALKNDDRGNLKAGDVKRAFGNVPTDSHATDLLRGVSDSSGFRLTKENGELEVRIHAEELEPEYLAGAYDRPESLHKARAKVRSKDEKQGETSRGSPSRTEKLRNDAKSTMDELDSATIGEIATDGGRIR